MNHKIAASIICCMALFLPAVVQAEDNAPESTQGITVNGHAEVDAKPDVAYASLGVVVQSLSQTDAVAQDAAKSDAVKDALLKAGVSNDDIKTESYQVQPQYDYRTSTAVLTGYQVSNFFKVAIHNLPKAGVIVDRASQAGANQVDGITYDLSDRSQVEGQALAAAVTNAREKADLVAGVSGVSVGRLLNITETGEGAPPPVFPMYRMAPAAAQAAQPTTPLKPADIVVTADVTALYSIGYGK